MFRGQRAGSYFSTVEVGFSAFVPFSEKWAMNLKSSGQYTVGKKSFPASFSFEPSGQSGTGTFTAGWKQTVKDYSKKAKQNPNILPILQMMEDTPDVRMRSRAAALSEELGKLLQSDSIYKMYAGAKEELEEKIVMDWAEYASGHVENTAGAPGMKALEERTGKVDRRWQKFEGIGGGETLDLAAKGEAEAERLEYALNRMASHFGDDFVKDVQGIEVTKEARNKFLQQIYNATEFRGSVEERLQDAGNTFKDYIMAEYKKVEREGDSMFEVAEKISGGSKPEGSGVFVKGEFKKGAINFMSMNPATLAYSGGSTMETPSYIARQVIRRFNEIAVNLGKETGAYIYHLPLSDWQTEWNMGKSGEMQWERGVLPTKGQNKNVEGNSSFLVGFIKLSPQFEKQKRFTNVLQGLGMQGAGGSKLIDIVVSAKVSDMSALWAEAQEIISQKEYEKMMEAASSVVYGTFAQWLMYDLAVKTIAKQENLKAVADIIAVVGANQVALTGRRGELIGSSIWQQVTGISQGAIGSSIDIQAVQTLTTPEITAAIEKQFADFVDTNKNKGWGKHLKAFYEKAVQNSNEISRQWRADIGVNDRGAALWRKGPRYLYEGPKSRFGQKMGIPWFFHSGKNPMDYMRFASAFSKGTVPFLNKVSSASDLPGYSDDKYEEMAEIYRGLGWERAMEWTPADKSGGAVWAGEGSYKSGQGFKAQKGSKKSKGYYETIY